MGFILFIMKGEIKMLKKLKIVHKIILLCVIMLLFIGSVGILGFYSNFKANTAMKNMYTDNLLPVKNINDARAMARANDANVLNIILNSGNPSALQPYIDDIDIRVKTYNEDFDAYKNTKLAPYELERITNVEKSLVEYRDVRSNIIKLAQEGKRDEAYKVFVDNEKLANTIHQDLKELADYNAKAAEDIDKQNISDFNKSIIFLIAIILSALVIGILLSLTTIAGITKPIALLKTSLDELSLKGGDLTHKIEISNKDEIGALAGSINKFLGNLREIIAGVITEAKNVDNAVERVNINIISLNNDIEEVSSTTQELSAGMEETAASTEEMNATSTEIELAIQSIANRAEEGAAAAGEIKKRANELMNTAIISQKNANDVYANTHDKLKEAIEASKAVDKINELSNAILSISSQTNLLALNAAIEAARAGEAGRGFAVVADEIRKLADESQKTAGQIQNITKTVVGSVENLSISALDVLSFIDTQVFKDYEMIVVTGKQYSSDAEMINNLVGDFSATSEEVLASMGNMVQALGEITNATGEGANGTSVISSKSTQVVDKTAAVIKEVNISKSSAIKLIGYVNKFKV